VHPVFDTLARRARDYFRLIKSWQTALLLISGLAGYLSAREAAITPMAIGGLLGSLVLAISGSTVLNMVYDRDIDQRMVRTRHRPLPAGRVAPREALVLGLVLSVAGAGWALAIYPLYGMVVAAGLFFNLVIYTLWLKRRTPWAIIWGGIAGGMPVLAGRVLGTGAIDAIGFLLVAAVLFWIPTHIITFSIRYREDYRSAGVPVLPLRFGDDISRVIVSISTLLAVAAFLAAARLLELQPVYWYLMIGLGAVLLAVALGAGLMRSAGWNLLLFKAASVYMLTAMLLIILGV